MIIGDIMVLYLDYHYRRDGKWNNRDKMANLESVLVYAEQNSDTMPQPMSSVVQIHICGLENKLELDMNSGLRIHHWLVVECTGLKIAWKAKEYCQ